MKNAFLTLTGYQMTWMCCVFGEYYNFPTIGLLIGILYLIIFFYFVDNKKRAIKICLIISLIGYSFDSILSFNKLYLIESEIIIGYLPIWFTILWPSFSTLFVNVLVFLKNRPMLAFLIGSSLAPLTYYSGIPLGIAKTINLNLLMIIMIIFWGMLLVLYSLFINQLTLFKNKSEK
tara:strand:+ start:297 stop:824 length:528 start_codon:yes stop_codon:yes gene_type:complete